ncbi:MAG: hypothetical protein WBZ24_10445 [Anaerolineales bacterium]
MPAHRIARIASLAPIGLTLVLAACAAPPLDPTPIAVAGPSATSLFPSRTPTITTTSTATPPPAPPTQTPTVTGTFMQASVYGVSRLSGHRLLVSITVPAAESHPSLLSRPFTAVVGTSDLDCEVLPQYLDRLYCSGPDPYVNYKPQAAELALFADGQAGSVFVTEFTIPALPTLTPTPSQTPEPSATP